MSKISIVKDKELNIQVEIPTREVNNYKIYISSQVPFYHYDSEHDKIYYIQELSNIKQISAIQILDGKNGFMTYSQFVCQIKFSGLEIPNNIELSSVKGKFDSVSHELSITVDKKEFKLNKIYQINNKLEKQMLVIYGENLYVTQ